MFPSQDDRPPSYRILEQTRTPPLSLVLAYAPMLPFGLGAIWVWTAAGGEAATATHFTTLWGGAILAFLAGVRRGLTFRSPNGETTPQLVTMGTLFIVATAALVTSPSGLSVGLLVLGFASVAIMDWRAALREEAPPYFARLRPIQMMIPIVCLLSILPKVDAVPGPIHDATRSSFSGS